MNDQDRFDKEVTSKRWYEDMDKDQKFIDREEAITEMKRLGINNDFLSHTLAAMAKVEK
jgi:hypothetical protein